MSSSNVPDFAPEPLSAQIGATPSTESGPAPTSASVNVVGPRVLVLDDVEQRVRQPRDAFHIGLAALGIVALLVASTYVRTSAGDLDGSIPGVNSVMQILFMVPVVVLESLVTLAVPVAVISELAFRKLGRQVIESTIAMALGLVLAVTLLWAIRTWGSDALVEGLSVTITQGTILTVPGYIAGLCGLLTAAGPRTRRRSVNVAWNVLWVSLVIVLLTGNASIAGTLIAVLIGRIAGLVVRYISGVKSERAYGDSLVRGVRRAGFDPISLVRVRDVTVEHNEDSVDYVSHPLTQDSDTRVYAMHRIDGPRLDVVVLDGDRQLIGVIQRFWRSLRLRGIEGRSAISLRAVAERAALMNYAVQNSGVRTQNLLGVAEADDSMILVFEHPERAIPVSSLTNENISDDLMREAWLQLSLAHKAGLAHRALSADLLLSNVPTSLDPAFPAFDSPKIWITGWQSGDIASASLARHMDNSQLLALFATIVGPERAVAIAREAISAQDLAKVGPLLQPVIMPSTTRDKLRKDKKLLGDLRKALVTQMPDTAVDVEPMQITRFGFKTILTWTITVIAVGVVFTTIQFDQIVAAVTTSNPWWAVVTFLLGVLTWVGAALTFVGFASVRIPVIKATIVQAAASFVALAAPAGIGCKYFRIR